MDKRHLKRGGWGVIWRYFGDRKDDAKNKYVLFSTLLSQLNNLLEYLNQDLNMEITKE